MRVTAHGARSGARPRKGESLRSAATCPRPGTRCRHLVLDGRLTLIFFTEKTVSCLTLVSGWDPQSDGPGLTAQACRPHSLRSRALGCSPPAPPRSAARHVTRAAPAFLLAFRPRELWRQHRDGRDTSCTCSDPPSPAHALGGAGTQ